jgi:hypothetical protein
MKFKLYYIFLLLYLVSIATKGLSYWPDLLPFKSELVDLEYGDEENKTKEKGSADEEDIDKIQIKYKLSFVVFKSKLLYKCERNSHLYESCKGEKYLNEILMPPEERWI